MAFSRSPSYLYCRQGTFYFRLKVPDDLRQRLGRREFRYSLGAAAGLQQARIRAMRGSVAAGRLFDELRDRSSKLASLTDQQIQEFADQWLRQSLEEAHQERVAVWKPQPVNGPEDYLDSPYRAGLDEGYHRAAEDLEAYNYSRISSTVEAVLKDHSISLDRASPDFAKLYYALLRAELEFYRVEQRRSDHDYSDLYAASQVATPALPYSPHPPPSLPRPNLRLFEAVEQYVAEKLRTKKWQSQTVVDERPKLELFAELLGNPPCNHLTSDLVRDYREKLQGLPKNRNKSPKYREKLLKEIVAMEVPEEDLLHPRTVRGIFVKVRGFLGWLKKQKYIVEPDLGDILEIDVKEESQRTPKGFTLEELRLLFHAPEYAKDTFTKPYQFWLPILALFTGARVEELCQLHLDDLRQEKGVWVLDINKLEEKGVKTAAAARLIPIHPFLMEGLRLLDYRDKLRRQGHHRLFPEIKVQNRKGKYSHRPIQEFKEFRESAGIKGQRKGHHKFRETVINTLKQKRVDKVMRQEVVGHEPGDVHEGYSDHHNPDILLEDVIMRLTWDRDLDLSHLTKSQYVIK